MDAIEKKVVRWKKHLIATNVVWSEDFVRALKQRHLVSDGVILQIEVSALGQIWLICDRFGNLEPIRELSMNYVII
jgi:hypothetical protein